MSFKSWLTTLASESSLTWRNRRLSHRMAGRRAPRQLEILEDRTLLAAALSEFMDPNPAAGNLFGHSFVALSTGNIVITSPLDDFGGTDAGAVYLFKGVPVSSSAPYAAPRRMTSSEEASAVAA